MEAILVEALAPLPLVAGCEVDADDEVALFKTGASAGDAELIQCVKVLSERFKPLIVRHLQPKHRPQTTETPVRLLAHCVTRTQHLGVHFRILKNFKQNQNYSLAVSNWDKLVMYLKTRTLKWGFTVDKPWYALWTRLWARRTRWWRARRRPPARTAPTTTSRLLIGPQRCSQPRPISTTQSGHLCFTATY